MRCLVTGGAGFIGSNLVKVLVDRGDDVTVIDDLSVGRIEHLEDCKNDIDFVTGSVCDLDLMRQLTSNTDTVFHLAVKCLMACNSDLTLANEVNVGGTLNVCIAANEAHAKIVYVSSSEVYGTSKFSPMTEKHPKNPQSIYGLSKLIGEEYVQLFNRLYHVPAVIIRPFNSYGPNHRNDQYSAVITAFIRRLENGQYPVIEGTGEQSRDFTYVSDTAEGIALLSKLEHGEIVNIGSGKATSINYLASLLMKIYGKEDTLIYAKPRPNDVFKLQAYTELAKSYGYKQKVPLEEGLRKYLEWWGKNHE